MRIAILVYATVTLSVVPAFAQPGALEIGLQQLERARSDQADELYKTAEETI
jgi:hypothetical protein